MADPGRSWAFEKYASITESSERIGTFLPKSEQNCSRAAAALFVLVFLAGNKLDSASDKQDR